MTPLKTAGNLYAAPLRGTQFSAPQGVQVSSQNDFLRL